MVSSSQEDYRDLLKWTKISLHLRPFVKPFIHSELSSYLGSIGVFMLMLLMLVLLARFPSSGFKSLLCPTTVYVAFSFHLRGSTVELYISVLLKPLVQHSGIKSLQPE